jgi:hypothetical protein
MYENYMHNFSKHFHSLKVYFLTTGFAFKIFIKRNTEKLEGKPIAS